MIVYFIAVALLAICKPCMSLDALKQQGLTASNVNDGTEMTFDLHEGNGTGSAYYDVTVRAMYGRPKSLSVKLCKIEGAHFDFEMATMNTLRDALGGNEEKFVSYGFPHIVSVGYLDKHPIIIYPRFGMSLAEKLKISVQISQRDAHNREMLTIVYTVVKIAELCNSKGVVVGKFSTKDIIITPHIHIRDLIRAQRYKPPINWYSYWGHTPSKGSANFLETDARYTRATDVYQLADMMDSVFPHKIPECRTNDKVFPEDFTVRARAIYGDNDPRYWDLLGTITRCMTTIGMSIPNYPALPPESLIAL